MRSFTRKIVFLMVLGVFLTGFTPYACAEKKEQTYAMVVFLNGSEFFNWAYAGMADAAKLLGEHVKVELHGPKDWDATLEAKAIIQLTHRKVDGIIATAGDAKKMIPSIRRADKSGIPVILFDSDSPESDRLAFVGTNNYNAGFEAGTEMGKWLGGKGDIGISTFKGPAHLQERVNGFKAGVSAVYPNAKIIEVDDEGKTDRAGPKITAMLKVNPNIKGIFAAHGNPGPGAAQAVRKLGLQGKVHIMGFDFGSEVVKLVENGELRATVGQNPYLMGYISMLLAYSARHPTQVQSANGKMGHTPKEIDTGVRILKKADMADLKAGPPVVK
ncbi:MAG: sugar ABC transporter substrate-binding protein [Desulfobacteraceae bacterium]|nr:sugar ABC transporter substrate-binding protein [Desulfobacteraceae bacterium]